MRKVPVNYSTNGLFVTGVLFNPRFKPGPVEFLLDTGASQGSISPKDQFLLRIDPIQLGLPRCSTRIVTAGGKANAFVLDDSMICLRDEENRPVNLEIPGILMMERLGRVSGSRRDLESQKMNETTPSIIGRDILERYGITLHVEFGRKIAYLLVP